jgi:metal-responsive CopG/Arc/MetJ family transcriptional regulator
MEKRTQLNVPIEPELLTRLKIVAVKKGTSVSDIVRQLVTAYVTKKEAEDV